MNPIEDITTFVESFSIPDNIQLMEEMISKSIGYSQWLGGRVNAAELDYANYYAECLDKLSRLEDETETTRKARLNSWTADKKRTLQDLKLLFGNLKSIRMALMQGVKTRRSEPY
jgi:hypothetical protein